MTSDLIIALSFFVVVLAGAYRTYKQSQQRAEELRHRYRVQDLEEEHEELLQRLSQAGKSENQVGIRPRFVRRVEHIHRMAAHIEDQVADTMDSLDTLYEELEDLKQGMRENMVEEEPGDEEDPEEEPQISRWELIKG